MEKSFIYSLTTLKPNFNRILYKNDEYYNSSEQTILENIINNMDIHYKWYEEERGISFNIDRNVEQIRIPEKLELINIERLFKQFYNKNITRKSKETTYNFFDYNKKTYVTYKNNTHGIYIKNNYIKEIKGRKLKTDTIEINDYDNYKNIFNLSVTIDLSENIKEVLELYNIIENSIKCEKSELINKEEEIFNKYLVEVRKKIRTIEDIFSIEGENNFELGRIEIKYILKKGTNKEKNQLKKYIKELKEELLNYFEKNQNQNQVLIDIQLENNQTLKYGLGESITNKEIIDKVLKVQKGSKIYLRIPKEGIENNKLIGFNIEDLPKDIYIMDRSINDVQLVKQMDIVYTRTTFLGFEALMIGCEVVCFAMPFYAGWGLTHDYVNLDSYIFRRWRKNVSIIDLFVSIYLIYSDYDNPYNPVVDKKRDNYYLKNSNMLLSKEVEKDYPRKRITYSNLNIEVYSIDEVKLQDIVSIYNKYKKRELKKESKIFLYGFDDLKIIKHFLKQYKEENIKYLSENFFSNIEDKILFNLEKTTKNKVIEKFNNIGNELMGVIIKDKGEYYSLLEEEKSSPYIPEEETTLEKKIINRMRNKILEDNFKEIEDFTELYKKNKTYNLEEIQIKTNKKIILIVGQKDESISLKEGTLINKVEMVKNVKENYKDYYLIYKLHPKEELKEEIKEIVDLISEDNVYALIKKVDKVATISSFVGLEAKVINEKVEVIVYGLPFYACWGLTIDKSTNPMKKELEKRRKKGLFFVYGFFEEDISEMGFSLKDILYAYLKDYNLYISKKDNQYYELDYFLKREMNDK